MAWQCKSDAKADGGFEVRLFILLLAAILTASCGASVAPRAPVESPCFGETFPAGTELTILAAHEGPIIRINGGWFTHPQVIVVSSRRAVLWDFSGFPADKLRGIIAYGAEPPTFNGAPDVPIRMVSPSDPTASKHCGSVIPAHQAGVTLEALLAQAEEMTGLAATRIRTGYRVDSFDASANGQQPAEVDPHGRPATEDRSPGFANVAPLIAQGAIRAAKPSDIAAYNRRASEVLRSGRFVAYNEERLGYDLPYVVLKPLVVPPGMTGANSRVFIVPAGVPAPTDKGSHNSYFFMDDGHCTALGTECPGSPVERFEPAKEGKPSRSDPVEWDDSADGPRDPAPNDWEAPE